MQPTTRSGKGPRARAVQAALRAERHAMEAYTGFTRNPLDRRHNDRHNEAFLSEFIAKDSSLFFCFRGLKPLVKPKPTPTMCGMLRHHCAYPC